MNTLFYAPQMAAYGGMERHICSLAALTARRGHHVTLLTTSNSLGADLRTEIDHPSISLHELPAARNHAGKIRKLQWLLSEVLKARRQSWDLIYTNGQSALARVVWHAADESTRRVHHHHTAADAGEQATWSDGFRRVLRDASELVACSRATREAINHVVKRTNTVFLPYLTRCPVGAESVRDIQPGTTLNFGFMGRLIGEKGIDAICRLSADPTLAHITWHLHGAGRDYPPEFFRAWPRIVYHGAYIGTTAQAAALAQLDAIVLFSVHNEGMPLSLIEAMSAGLPWIATDRGGTRELAVSPANCVVVSHPASDADLRNAVNELSIRIRSGNTSRVAQRNTYDKNFSPSVVGRRWTEFIEAHLPISPASSPAAANLLPASPFVP
ncbi:MAG TPA: glycosyltransferase family 4 protein [Lacunisphaera sp.]|jgi:glycosyltransferase involved in cell wall biosynthesis